MSKNKKRLGLTLTSIYVEALDQLVEKGLYTEPQEAIREALRSLFHSYGIEPFLRKVSNDASIG